MFSRSFGETNYNLADFWVMDLRFELPVLSWAEDHPRFLECAKDEVASLITLTELNWTISYYFDNYSVSIVFPILYSYYSTVIFR
jgi:hypothetical protein